MTTVFFSTRPDHDLNAQLTRLDALPVLPPFSLQARGFVGEFAQRVLRLPNLRQFPELATLAHWFRPAMLNQMAHKVAATEGSVVLARGRVFLLAPANVDVLFAYAWLMSVLCGNRNIARLSQKPGAQRDALVGVLQLMHEEGKYPEVLERMVLLTYPHDDAITQAISADCHARIVWGGDATVARIRAVPLAPLALELVFPDRFGVAAFRASAITALSVQELSDLARRFCNDTLWFGQQACSSPRCLYWVGDSAQIATAKAVFWPAVHDHAAQFENESASVIARTTDAHLLAASGHQVTLSGDMSSYPMRLAATQAGCDIRAIQTGYGMVVEVDLDSLGALAGQLGDRDQTLVQYGFGAGELVDLLATLGNRAIDRVTPVGRALDFHHVWDGNDLFKVFTRQITLSSS